MDYQEQLLKARLERDIAVERLLSAMKYEGAPVFATLGMPDVAATLREAIAATNKYDSVFWAGVAALPDGEAA